MNEDMEKMLQEAPAPILTLEPFAEEKEEPAVVEKKKRCSRLMKKKNKGDFNSPGTEAG